MGFFNFFNVSKNKKPDYGKIVIDFLSIALMDKHIYKLFKSPNNGNYGKTQKLSELSIYNQIIEEVLKPNKSEDEKESEEYIFEDSLIKSNIKTEKQKSQLKEILRNSLLNLYVNNFKYCFYEGDLDFLLNHINRMERIGLSSNKYMLWKERIKYK